jgi:hypothetical protein
MDRAAASNFEQPCALFLGEITQKRDLPLNPIYAAELGFARLTVLGVDARVMQSDYYFLEQPMLLLRVHLYGHRRAGTQ